MTLSIRNQDDVDRLARRLAEIDNTSVTKAVVTALEEAIKAGTLQLNAARYGASHPRKARTDLSRKPEPVLPEAFRHIDHDLAD